jgi:DNA-binding response OmpR family regulator
MTTDRNIVNSQQLQPKKHTLLIYDENPYIANAFRNNLMGRGFHVVVTSDYEDCLQQFYGVQPHAVLLDLSFWNPNVGISLLFEMRKQNDLVPILMMAAAPDHRFIKKSELLGANSFIQKPFEVKILQDAITKFIDSIKRF